MNETAEQPDIVVWLKHAPSDEWCGPMLNKAAEEIERLRRIVTTIVPEAGCFDPDDDEQVERIALEWCERFHALKKRVAELEGVANAE